MLWPGMPSVIPDLARNTLVQPSTPSAVPEPFEEYAAMSLLNQGASTPSWSEEAPPLSLRDVGCVPNPGARNGVKCSDGKLGYIHVGKVHAPRGPHPTATLASTLASTHTHSTLPTRHAMLTYLRHVCAPQTGGTTVVQYLHAAGLGFTEFDAWFIRQTHTACDTYV